MKKSVLTILSLISLTILIPNTGFGGEPPPPGKQLSLPPYIGNLTVEWHPTGTSTCSNFLFPEYAPGTHPCGEVIIYGELNCAEKRCRDITITKRKAITYPKEITQGDFLSLGPTDLTFRGFSFLLPLGGPGTFFWVTSADDLIYQTETLFTVDVVVMEFK
jgi:hypothetical protein